MNPKTTDILLARAAGALVRSKRRSNGWLRLSSGKRTSAPADTSAARPRHKAPVTLGPNWAMAQTINSEVVNELMSLVQKLRFDAMHAPNGVGKSTLGAERGSSGASSTATPHSAAEEILELAALDSDSALRQHLHYYATPELLLSGRVSYISYSNLSVEKIDQQETDTSVLNNHNNKVLGLRVLAWPASRWWTGCDIAPRQILHSQGKHSTSAPKHVSRARRRRAAQEGADE